MKSLATLLDTPNIPGAEAAILSDVPAFPEKYIGEIYVNDPWFGTIPLTLEPYVPLTYAAYTPAAPPAWDHIMFNANRTGFKCGTGLWWGVLQAYILPYGS